MRPAHRRELARWLTGQYRVSERRVARVTLLARSTFRYQPVERCDEPPSSPHSRDRHDPRAIRIMEQISCRIGQAPMRIQVDNGSEFISKVLDQWAYDNGVTLTSPDPENPPITRILSLSMGASVMSV